MKFSLFCIPTLKEVPSDVKLKSHELMLRTGMIRQETSGIYTWLPLGFKVIKKIEKIISDEHQELNINQILMPTIQSAEIWKKSERYESYGEEMLKIQDRNKKELVYGPTNEEMMTMIGSSVIRSYKSFPISFFHIQSKFRDEIRPRFGVMRAREFLMKDAYSFDLNREDMKSSYRIFFDMYLRIFKKMGLQVLPVSALSGEIGGDLSHEFHVICDSGESEIYIDSKYDSTNFKKKSLDSADSFFASTTEFADVKSIPTNGLIKKKSIELGHIFSFGDKYTKKINFKVNTPDGNKYPFMGSYGIGLSRIPAAVIEIYNDEKGIIWPKEISPFDLIILNLKYDDTKCCAYSEELYTKLTIDRFDVLFDDRNERVGVKFSEADLIGIPIQVIVGTNFVKNNTVQIKSRRNNIEVDVRQDHVIEKLNSMLKDD